DHAGSARVWHGLLRLDSEYQHLADRHFCWLAANHDDRGASHAERVAVFLDWHPGGNRDGGTNLDTGDLERTLSDALHVGPRSEVHVYRIRGGADLGRFT